MYLSGTDMHAKSSSLRTAWWGRFAEGRSVTNVYSCLVRGLPLLSARAWKSPQQMSKSILIFSFASRWRIAAYILSSSPWQHPSTATCIARGESETTSGSAWAHGATHALCTVACLHIARELAAARLSDCLEDTASRPSGCTTIDALDAACRCSHACASHISREWPAQVGDDVACCEAFLGALTPLHDSRTDTLATLATLNRAC